MQKGRRKIKYFTESGVSSGLSGFNGVAATTVF
jgi:hypothetical protein